MWLCIYQNYTEPAVAPYKVIVDVQMNSTSAVLNEPPVLQKGQE